MKLNKHFRLTYKFSEELLVFEGRGGVEEEQVFAGLHKSPVEG